jgi:hypothetical protein
MKDSVFCDRDKYRSENESVLRSAFAFFSLGSLLTVRLRSRYMMKRGAFFQDLRASVACCRGGYCPRDPQRQ